MCELLWMRLVALMKKNPGEISGCAENSLEKIWKNNLKKFLKKYPEELQQKYQVEFIRKENLGKS